MQKSGRERHYGLSLQSEGEAGVSRAPQRPHEPRAYGSPNEASEESSGVDRILWACAKAFGPAH